MEGNNMQIMAGMLSSIIFMTGSVPMIVKAYRSKNLKSYSFMHLVMGNIGNWVHWIYVSSLPFGPVWVLHAFFTLSATLMLIGYLRYEAHWHLSRLHWHFMGFGHLFDHAHAAKPQQ